MMLFLKKRVTIVFIKSANWHLYRLGKIIIDTPMPLDSLGLIIPIASISHIEKGHGLDIMCGGAGR